MAAMPLAACGDNGDGDSDGSDTSAASMTSTNPPPTSSEPTGGDEPTTGETTAGDDTTSSEPVLISYAADIQPIFTASCVAGCHVAGGTAAANVILGEGSYANIVDEPAPQLPTMSLIKPGDANNSYLWHKLNDTWQQVGGSGLKMPQGSSGLPQDQLDLIKKWIDGGALP